MNVDYYKTIIYYKKFINIWYTQIYLKQNPCFLFWQATTYELLIQLILYLKHRIQGNAVADVTDYFNQRQQLCADTINQLKHSQ